MQRPSTDIATTRFAPSPNGPLHLGHAYSAVIAHDLARDGGGQFVLRIEDIDGPRSRPELAQAFRDDLAWLGLSWREVPAQSQRLQSYAAAAQRLRTDGLLYPCRCTRAQIAAEQARLGIADGRYPGTCRGADRFGAGQPGTGELPVAWRLDAGAALARTGPLAWHDALAGPQAVEEPPDDVVLVRKNLPASYHLAATLDDAADAVTLVTRGQDLFAMTPIHRLLQALLGLPVPRWHHHPLLLDERGEKLAKRRGSPSLADRRRAGEDGHALADALRRGELPAGISLSTS